MAVFVLLEEVAGLAIEEVDVLGLAVVVVVAGFAVIAD